MWCNLSGVDLCAPRPVRWVTPTYQIPGYHLECSQIGLRVHGLRDEERLSIGDLVKLDINLSSCRGVGKQRYIVLQGV